MGYRRLGVMAAGAAGAALLVAGCGDGGSEDKPFGANNPTIFVTPQAQTGTPAAEPPSSPPAGGPSGSGTATATSTGAAGDPKLELSNAYPDADTPPKTLALPSGSCVAWGDKTTPAEEIQTRTAAPAPERELCFDGTALQYGTAVLSAGAAKPDGTCAAPLEAKLSGPRVSGKVDLGKFYCIAQTGHTVAFHAAKKDTGVEVTYAVLALRAPAAS
ncbi:hypothetical protein [Yinghuangia soli]|uniref:Uncharacterized protein n=1 Tax=Yinghuangia soli TaxID=2908204 RepID=A0AA41PY30_9ACTN|nr:hypothetical protein [Yinghuangia soli]MCF2527510.1 hypothetical protein [Yinghuangia soli]